MTQIVSSRSVLRASNDQSTEDGPDHAAWFFCKQENSVWEDVLPTRELQGVLHKCYEAQQFEYLQKPGKRTMPKLGYQDSQRTIGATAYPNPKTWFEMFIKSVGDTDSCLLSLAPTHCSFLSGAWNYEPSSMR